MSECKHKFEYIGRNKWKCKLCHYQCKDFEKDQWEFFNLLSEIKKLEDEKIFSFMINSYRETAHYFEVEFLKKKIKELEQKLADAEKVNEWISVDKEGQIKQGDWILIFGKSMGDNQFTYVDEILSINDNEEILFDRELNRYFITSLYLEGKSWVKRILIHRPITPPQEGK